MTDKASPNGDLIDALADPDAKRFADGEPLVGIPFAHEIGMRMVERGPGFVRMAIPYDPRLIGDPDTGVIGGGAVTVLLDTCGGMAVFSSPTPPTSTATLDLRIDYMRPAAPNMVLYAEARCFRETKSITFVRAVAFHKSPDAPVAAAMGAFMAEGRKKLPSAQSSSDEMGEPPEWVGP